MAQVLNQTEGCADFDLGCPRFGKHANDSGGERNAHAGLVYQSLQVIHLVPIVALGQPGALKPYAAYGSILPELSFGTAFGGCMESRRHFMTAAGGAAALTPVLLHGQGNSAWAGKISPAIGTAVLQAAVDVSRRKQGGQPVADSLHTLTLMSAVFFRHLDEVGGINDLEKQLRGSSRLVTAEDLAGVRAKAAAAGVVVEAAAFARLLTFQAEGRQQFARLGMRGSNQQLLAGLQAVAERQAKIERAAVSGEAGVFRAQSDFCWYFNWVVFYVGWVSIFSPPGIDVLLGAVSGIGAAYSMIFC